MKTPDRTSNLRCFNVLLLGENGWYENGTVTVENLESYRFVLREIELNELQSVQLIPKHQT